MEIPRETIKDRDYVVELESGTYLVPEKVGRWVEDMWQLYAALMTRVHEDHHIIHAPSYMQPKVRRVEDGDH